MKIFNHKGKMVSLGDEHFIAEGGEGRLYAHKGQVYKICIDSNKIIPLGKLDELMMLDHPAIIRPTGSIFNGNNERIGYSMKQIPNPVGLPRLFTSTFWNSNNMTLAIVSDLIKRMQETLTYIHKKGFLQVDGNEFNYLLNQKFNKPYFIDVDSYQTPSFQASAIMPSIRDYTQNEFNEGSDWFSFAIIAFQLLTGIHPFKGSHPDFKKGDFEGRIKAGVSVFHKDVSYPSAVRDFSLIPPNYKDWFFRLFENGERIAPPTGMAKITVTPVRRVVKDGSKVSLTCLAKYKEVIRRVNTVNGQRIVFSGKQLYVSKRPYEVPAGYRGIVMRDNAKPLFIEIDYQGIVGAITSEEKQRISSGLEAERVFIANNIAYIIQSDNLIELVIIEALDSIVIAPGVTWKILPNATTIFSGIIYQNVLGKTHLMVPIAKGEMPIIKVPELDQYKIIDGRYERAVAYFMVADKKGVYWTVRIRFNEYYNDYDIEIRDDIEDALNFTVLDKKIIITMIKDGQIEVVSSVPGNNAVKVVDDQQISSFLRLYNDAGAAAVTSNKEIYRIALRS